MASNSTISSTPTFRGRIARIERADDPPSCALADGTKLLIPRHVAAYLATGDEVVFPLPSGTRAGAELYITKNSPVGRTSTVLYCAPIGYVSQPRKDKRDQAFVSAEVHDSGFGISSVYLRCDLLRDYFYRQSRDTEGTNGMTLYESLGVPANASPPELRVAFKLRRLELNTAEAPRSEQVALERAFNILALPELRASHDALSRDPALPVPFPYGGFGSLLAIGEPSRDGHTFFAQRILAFVPECRRRRFHAPLRWFDFYERLALCRDVRRKLEFWADPAVLHANWDPAWNRWKHLLATKVEVDGIFVQCGKYRKRRGEWELITWETALPSRLEIKLPPAFSEQVEAARRSYQRFGQYSRALDQIRLQLDKRAIEKTELDKMCAALRIPGDFDVAQINWRPDYDPFFYGQLARRARHIYLFKDEYIFDLERALVAETPALGHATYVFSKPRSVERFLALYTAVSKEDIRRNRENAAERLGFLGRVIHGANPRLWLKEIRQRVGEAMDSAAAIAD